MVRCLPPRRSAPHGSRTAPLLLRRGDLCCQPEGWDNQRKDTATDEPERHELDFSLLRRQVAETQRLAEELRAEEGVGGTLRPLQGLNRRLVQRRYVTRPRRQRLYRR